MLNFTLGSATHEVCEAKSQKLAELRKNDKGVISGSR